MLRAHGCAGAAALTEFAMQLVNPQRLTRVIVDDADMDITQIGVITARIERALQPLPAQQRATLASALLNHAIARIAAPARSR